MPALAVSTPVPVAPSRPAEPPLYRFTVAQYHALIAAGILPEGAPIELIRGLVVTKMAKNDPHIFAARRLGDRLRPMLPPAWLVQSQDPIVLADSEPEPDQSVCLADVLEALGRKPLANEVALVAEVADSSLPIDRGVKKAMYAEARIPVYWIVNLVEFCIEAYADPVGSDYATRRDHGMADEVPVVLDGVEVGRIRVDAVIPLPQP